MSSVSPFIRRAMANHLLGGPDYPRPAIVYVALYIIAPDPVSGGGTEVTNIPRLAVDNTAINFPAATGNGVKQNGVIFLFQSPTIDIGNVVAAAIFDALTGGNRMMSGTLQEPRNVLANAIVRFPVGSITFTPL